MIKSRLYYFRRAAKIFMGRGGVVEIGHQDVGFLNETFRAVESQVGSWSDTQSLALGRFRR